MKEYKKYLNESIGGGPSTSEEVEYHFEVYANKNSSNKIVGQPAYKKGEHLGNVSNKPRDIKSFIKGGMPIGSGNYSSWAPPEDLKVMVVKTVKYPPEEISIDDVDQYVATKK